VVLRNAGKERFVTEVRRRWDAGEFVGQKARQRSKIQSSEGKPANGLFSRTSRKSYGEPVVGFRAPPLAGSEM
jgi:hypothetical protein